jgi:hypothetical protein
MIMASGGYGKQRGIRVRPLSRTKIRAVAVALRKCCNEYAPWVDVARFIEHKLFSEFNVEFSVQPESVLGLDEGRTYPDKLQIQLREDVYEALIADDPRARFTAVHEVGHLFLHRGVPLRRTSAATDHKAFEDSESQANSFAAEFLMPVHFILGLQYRTAACASDVFGVSLQAAMIRMDVLRMEGVLPKIPKL